MRRTLMNGCICLNCLDCQFKGKEFYLVVLFMLTSIKVMLQAHRRLQSAQSVTPRCGYSFRTVQASLQS